MPSFMPHGMCFPWRTDLLAPHVVAVAAIALCCLCLPVLVFTFVRRRPAFRRFDRIDRELEAQCRLIVETSNDGIWLTDRAGVTTFVNARVAEMLGYECEEFVGKPIVTFLYDEPAQRKQFALLGGPGAPASGALCFARKDGSALWTQTKRRAIVDADGDCAGSIALIADASAQRSAQAAIADSENRHRLLAEAMPHLVFTTDAVGNNDYCNRAWFAYTGLPARQPPAADWIALIHPDDVPRMKDAWKHAVATGEPLEIELRLRRADGTYRWFISRATPVRDANGAVVRWIGSAADIDDFKLASETRNVLDLIGHFISIRNERGGLEYISPVWLEFLGITAETAGTGSIREFVHPDDIGILDDLYRLRREMPRATQQNELRVRDRHGVYRWFLIRTVALLRSEGGTQRKLLTLTEIDDLKRAQAAAGQSERRYRALTDAMPQLVWILDEHANFEYVNERWTHYTGLTLDPDAPRNSATVVHPDDQIVLDVKHAALRSGHDFECEVRIRRHDGVYRWYLLRAVPLGDTTGAEAKWIVTATDIDARKAAEAALAASTAELTHRADHDPLTNLPNRVRLMERLEQMTAVAEAGGTEVVVLYLDLDHFKEVNDTLGHQLGDKVLIETATRINAILRAGDVASRFGGDEFVVVCAAADGDDATGIANRIAAAVRAPLELAGQRVVVSSSIGISIFPHDGTRPAELIQRADSAMYRAKESGRDGWCRSSAQTHVPAVSTLELEVELREAVALEQLVVHYQPIVDTTSGKPVGAEALVRWLHPKRGLLGPGEFIPFAEDHGLIAPIGELVLDAAGAQLRRLALSTSADFSIAVNVSARQFQKPGFVDRIAATIEKHGLAPQQLEIEITESTVMYDTTAVKTTLEQLEALGVKLSIDDFGTGYSSLAYLKTFPIHTLKIDRSFVTDIADDPTDAAIAKTIITLAHSLGMRVIAEGVETAAQRDLLRSFGSDCIQGYLIAQPLPAADLEAFLANGSVVGHAMPNSAPTSA